MSRQWQTQQKTISNSSATPVKTSFFQQRPFTSSAELETGVSKQEISALPSRQQASSHLGHDFSKLQVETHPVVPGVQRQVDNVMVQRDERDVDEFTYQGPTIGPADSSSASSQDEEHGPLYNFITNNLVSYETGLVSTAKDIPKAVFGSAEAGEALANAGKLPGMGVVNGILGPLGMLSNAESMSQDWGQGNYADAVVDALGFGSSAVTTAQGAGTLLTAAEGTSSGSALLGMLGAEGSGAAITGAVGVGGTEAGIAGIVGAGSLAGTAGAVAGSFAGGWALGRALDQGVDWLGDAITGNEGVDHSISGGIGKGLYAIDKAINGVTDDPINNPNDSYKNTWAWKLNEWLDS